MSRRHALDIGMDLGRRAPAEALELIEDLQAILDDEVPEHVRQQGGGYPYRVGRINGRLNTYRETIEVMVASQPRRRTRSRR